MERLKILRSEHKVTVIWECQWEEMKRKNPEIRAFVEGCKVFSIQYTKIY